MKTQEEVVRNHAIGPINIYQIYREGYQDRELDDWSSFRREAAKDILCALVSVPNMWEEVTYESLANGAIRQADELIKQLRDGKE